MTTMKEKYPMIHGRLGRMLGKDRKGLAHISADKTALWQEILALVEDHERSLAIEPEDPYRLEREEIKAQRDAIMADLERMQLEGEAQLARIQEMQRHVAAAVLVRDAWTNPGPNPLFHQKVQGWVRAHWPTLSKSLDRLDTIAGTVTP